MYRFNVWANSSMQNAELETMNNEFAAERDFYFRMMLRWGPFAIKALLRGLCATCRIIHLKENSKSEVRNSNFAALEGPRIYAGWHRDMIMLSLPYSHRGIILVISKSRDGEIGTRIARNMGYNVIRGSSSRGGITALKELMTMVRNRQDVGFFADGPRGPAGQTKAGVVYLACKTGAPLIPVAARADRCITFRSWDRMVLPLPFSRVSIVEGEPIIVPSGIDREEVSDYSRRLTLRLDNLQAALAGKGQS